MPIPSLCCESRAHCPVLVRETVVVSASFHLLVRGGSWCEELAEADFRQVVCTFIEAGSAGLACSLICHWTPPFLQHR